jgi:hypothetical protein
MDALRKHDIEVAQKMSLAEKLEATLQAMADGYELKRIQLKLRYPNLKKAEIEVLFRKWLLSED